MKRQWLIGALVAAAVGLLAGWIMNNTRWEKVAIPTMLGGEAARNPFYAAQRLVEALGATSEWRRTLVEMPDPDAIMVLTNWQWDLIESRRLRIQRWVESGGHLVVSGILLDGEAMLREWAGLGRASEKADDAQARARHRCREWKVLDGRSHVNRSRTSYSICVPVRLGYLTSTRQITWSVEAEGRVRAARVNVGDGSVTRIEAEPFGNYDLLDGEHAMLFADILELDRGDHVVFLSEKERASLLELIWTYGAPAVVLALLLTALALWRNAARFGPMAAPLDVSRRSLAEQIRGTAKFAVRVGGGRGLHAAMVRALHETARLHLRGYERMPAADRISAISRLAGIDSEELATARASKQHRSAHELRNSVALLDTARRRLMAGAASDGRQGGRRARRIRATFDPLHL